MSGSAESYEGQDRARSITKVLDELEHCPIVHQAADETLAPGDVSESRHLRRAPTTELAESLSRFDAE